jgi:D-sedoheptulose 7-phosphate isomerase
MTDKIKSIIQSSIDVKGTILKDEAMVEKIKTVAHVVTDCFKSGSRVYFCGNGGSAADAQHLAAEFTGRFYHDREPLPAEALHDYSYDQIYERMIKAQGRKGDVLFGISTSGNSKNIILAQEEAKRRGMITVSLTGETGGKMKDSADYLFNVPSTDTPRIQESHILIGHIICQLVEEMMM